ncbi:M56 family metallopeptidase [Sphingobacterium bambusae]|uniref:M56 family metallopeptidase n=1 Tax=Sphingobacterium bambusae TaxID=662858 RepID=A0ABW6BF80_9SPHI|nr:M56 family metallopeptidase [Sphingobacterium bambusae]WPL50308.1 M56 family metallopeptidase [Sphingobacterium bambusae]
MVYLILVNVSLLLCYALYSIFLKKLTFFQLNRIYLLGAVIVSLLIPIGLFIDMPRGLIAEETLPNIDLNLFLGEEMLLAEQADRAASMQDILQIVYWIGAGLALLWLCFRCSRVLVLLRSGNSTFSFAFFRTVVLADQVSENQVIAAHEQIHVAQGHSYDLVFVELVRVFNWFNPVLRLYLKELKFQHECIADEQSSVDRVAYAELLVAQAMQVERSHFLHEFSEKSFLKNRIAMLFKEKTQNKYKFLYLSIAPVLGLTLLSTLVFNSSKAKSLVRDIENKVEYTAVITAEPDTTGTKMKEDAEKQKVFTATEVNPEPVGGLANFRKWIGDNYSYPQEAVDAALKGQMVVSFIVEADGTLSNFEVIKDLGYGTGEAALDLLRKAAKWAPGIQNGRKVRVAYTLPITLNLEEDKKG